MSAITRELSGYPPILGLVGPLGSGKTTLANAVVDLVKGQRLSCAGPIRDMLHALGIPREDLTTNKNKPQPWLHHLTSRAMLKSLGTEWGRELVGPDIWINAVLRAAEKVGPRGASIVIDDIRFDNEARAVKEAGGHLFFVYHYGVGYSYAHPSECGLLDWDRLDGVTDLETGVACPYGPEWDTGFEDIIRPMPWWAKFALGRKLFGSKRPPIISTRLKPVTESASEVVRSWNLLTEGEATAHARAL